jgi:penicillin-binding protein 1A
VHAKRVLPRRTAETMQTMLAGVITSGTGRSARLKWYACGKTGTTSDYKDAWFIGFTKDMVSAVWMGNRDSTPMRRVFGSTIPAPTWKMFMSEAVPILRKEHGEPSAAAPMPVTQPPAEPKRTFTRSICVESGLLARPECPDVKTVTYTEGEEPAPPAEQCDIHAPKPPPATTTDGSARGTITLSVCSESGLLATENCPHVVNRTFAPEEAPSEPCPLHPASRGGRGGP